MFGCNNLFLRTLKKRKARNCNKDCANTNRKRASPVKCSEFQGEEGEDGFILRCSTHSVGQHVQPLGNLYMSPSRHNSRNSGLGNLRILTDELLLEVLGLLDGTHLGTLSTVSKSLYVFCSHEPLWRNLVLERFDGNFLYDGSWKSTYTCSLNPSFSSLIASPSRLIIRDFYSDHLFQSWLCANLDMKPEWLQTDNVPRRKGISVDNFVRNFEERNRPVLLEGLLDNWACFRKWDRDYLLEICGETKFSVGPVEMKLIDYFRYSDSVNEERPLYLFDPKFTEKVPLLGSEYAVPEVFREDLFGVLGSERPDYRWIIIGPKGSGSSFHIDPNSTSAWNAVIKGSKKWILFPPDVVPPGVHPSPDGSEVACPVSLIEWFMNFYGLIKECKRKPVECVCRSGEVLFVPNGWWHLVINLEETIAITQNFVSRRNLFDVVEFLKRPNAGTLVSGTSDRTNLYRKFRDAIGASFPGTLDQLMLNAVERKRERNKPTYWDSVLDSTAGGFRFSFE